jgi:hypothetical protein
LFSIRKCPVPANTLLEKYLIHGAYVDCYSAEFPGQVSFPEFVFAFYTTLLFKLERYILTFSVSKPSTDQQARQLADGNIRSFAAWQVENRADNELLMCDFVGRTRSWLMAVPTKTESNTRTQLYFGSAVVPKQNPKTGKWSLGFGYRSLLGFHKIYSILLLYSALLRIKSHSR